MRLARLAALERKKIEDEYLSVIQLIAELEDILANPARVLAIIKDELAELKRKYAGERRTRVVDDSNREMTDEDLIADEDVVVTISRRGYIKRQPVGDLPPPAPRRQGDHRPRHPRGGRGRAPAGREHPRLGAVLHQPRPRVLRQGPLDPRREPPGQGHGDHQPAGRPGGVGRGPGGDDLPAQLRARPLPGAWRPARASSRRRRSSSSSGSARPASARSRSTTDDELAWVGVSSGDDDVIIATAQGMLARFTEDEVRPMGRDAAGVIGIRLLKREGDSVVAMSIVEPDGRPARAVRDRLRQARPARRVPAQAPRRPGRPADRARGPQDGPRGGGPAGHRGGRGAACSSRPAARSSAPTSRASTATRSSARGVIVMRLAEGDTVAAIAAFRPGLADRDGIGDNDDPRARWWRTGGRGIGHLVMTALGAREADVYADQYEIYHGNANPELARKIAHYLGSEPGRAEVFEFANENIFVRILDNVREKDVFIVQPTSRPVNQSIMELLIMIDAFKRASRRADHGRRAVLRLRPLRQEGPAARPDHRAPDRGHDHGRRRGPDADDGPPPGPDPGVLQHPGRRAHGRPHAQPHTSSTESSRTASWSRTSGSRSAPGRSPSCSTRRWRSSRSAATATSTGPRSSTSSARSAGGARSSSTTRSTPRGR